MLRELQGEVGLYPHHVTPLGSTKRWLRYRLPERFICYHCALLCIGQKQVWFMLRVDCGKNIFCLDTGNKPEFDTWCWVRYWQPLCEVIYFKRQVYRQALKELAPLLYPEGPPVRRAPSSEHWAMPQRKRGSRVS